LNKKTIISTLLLITAGTALIFLLLVQHKEAFSLPEPKEEIVITEEEVKAKGRKQRNTDVLSKRFLS